VREIWPLAHSLFHVLGGVVAKQPKGTPMKAAPALKTSGYTPSSTLVIIAPDDAPVTKTRFGSAPNCCCTWLTIDRMPTGSLPPLRRNASCV
jgi:hypothetical protein